MKNLKKVLALVLVVATLLSFATIATAANPIDAYTDAKDVDNYWAVNVLTYLGIMAGYPDKTFKPDGTITRAEAAKIIAMLNNGTTDIEELYASANVFTDVPKGHWAESVIAYCAQTGIVAGKGGLTFDPQGEVTYVEFLKMALVCLGFDSKKEGYESNASWRVNVLEQAKKSGLTEGLAKDTVYTAPCTRQDAAQILLNALQSWIVDYGYEYKPNSTTTQYITTAGAVIVNGVHLYDHWMIKPGTSDDCFMRPYTTWNTVNAAGAVTGTLVKYENARIAEWNTPINACDVLVAAGVAKTDRDTSIKLDIYWNGAKQTDTQMVLSHDATHAIGQATSQYACYNNYFNSMTGNLTGQGVESILYKNSDGSYRLVVINTWLAQVTKAAANTVGKDGHLIASNNIELGVYDSDVCVNGAPDINTWKATDTGYAKGDMVLVRYSWKQVNGKDCGTFILGKADTKVGTITGYVTDPKALMNETEIDYVETPDALKFKLGVTDAKPGCRIHGDPIGKTYTFYFDQFGNVIGMTDYAASAGTLTVIDEIWQNDDRVQVVTADVVGLDAKETEGVNVKKLDGVTVNGTGINAATFLPKPSINPNAFYTESKLNTKFYDELYYAIVDANGNYTLTDAVAGRPTPATEAYVLDPASPVITDNGAIEYYTTEATRYLYHMDDGSYVAYTGYANIPLTNADVVDVIVGADGFATDVYVTGNIKLPGGNDVAFVYDTTKYYVKYVNDVEYEVWTVWIDGEKTTIYTEKDAISFGVNLYELSYANVDGLIVAKKNFITAYAGATAANKGYTEEVWRNLVVNGNLVKGTGDVTGDLAMNLTDVPVYIYDKNNKDIAAGTIANLDGNKARVIYKDGALYAIYVNIDEIVVS